MDHLSVFSKGASIYKLQLTSINAVNTIWLNIATVLLQRWIQHEKFVRRDVVKIGQFRASVVIDGGIGVSWVTTNDVPREGIVRVEKETPSLHHFSSARVSDVRRFPTKVSRPAGWSTSIGSLCHQNEEAKCHKSEAS